MYSRVISFFCVIPLVDPGRISTPQPKLSKNRVRDMIEGGEVYGYDKWIPTDTLADDDLPTVCYNDVYISEMTYTGAFLCPPEQDKDLTDKYCCNKMGQQYCCSFWKSGIGTLAIVWISAGVSFVILYIIVEIIRWTLKVHTKNKQYSSDGHHVDYEDVGTTLRQSRDLRLPRFPPTYRNATEFPSLDPYRLDVGDALSQSSDLTLSQIPPTYRDAKELPSLDPCRFGQQMPTIPSISYNVMRDTETPSFSASPCPDVSLTNGVHAYQPTNPSLLASNHKEYPIQQLQPSSYV